jgi:hypothetical protein
MKFEKAFEAFVAFLETLSEAMTAANSTNPVVIFFSVWDIGQNHYIIQFCSTNFIVEQI